MTGYRLTSRRRSRTSLTRLVQRRHSTHRAFPRDASPDSQKPSCTAVHRYRRTPFSRHEFLEPLAGALRELRLRSLEVTAVRLNRLALASELLQTTCPRKLRLIAARA